MKLKIKIKPKLSYFVSIFVSFIILSYFAYKGIVAYLIHRELYGGGIDTLVLLRASIAGIMFLLILLFIQFIKIPDLKSHRSILRGVFIGWVSVFIILVVVNLSSIYFMLLTAIVSSFTLLTLLSLENQIKEQKNTLTEKEIYLLQQLAKKNSLLVRKIIIFIIFIIFQNNCFAKDMILDQLKNPNFTTQYQQWNFVTDQVMGGVSTGKFTVEKIDEVICYRMTGDVSTKNNGGFIQIRAKLSPQINTEVYDGVYLKVYGNEKNYNLHLRTGLTLAPWQYYSFTFPTTKNWTEIRVPFSKFKKSNFYQPKKIFGQNIKSVGLVAGFDDFKSDICLSEIGFY